MVQVTVCGWIKLLKIDVVGDLVTRGEWCANIIRIIDAVHVQWYGELHHLGMANIEYIYRTRKRWRTTGDHRSNGLPLPEYDHK